MGRCSNCGEHQEYGEGPEDCHCLLEPIEVDISIAEDPKTALYYMDATTHPYPIESIIDGMEEGMMAKGNEEHLTRVEIYDSKGNCWGYVTDQREHVVVPPDGVMLDLPAEKQRLASMKAKQQRRADERRFAREEEQERRG